MLSEKCRPVQGIRLCDSEYILRAAYPTGTEPFPSRLRREHPLPCEGIMEMVPCEAAAVKLQ
jgi:hypothetical protein